MKKHLLSLFALASMVFVSSCTSEEIISQSTGNEVKVTFTTELRNDVKSRAVGDDTDNIDQLIFAVYDEMGNELPELRQSTHMADDNAAKAITLTAEEKKKKATIEVVLVKGQTYSFAFWAQKKGFSAYTFDPATAEVSVNYANRTANQREADAFFKGITNHKVTGTFTMDVTLKRPFAQVNFLTSQDDIINARKAGFNPNESAIIVKNVAKKLNVRTGEVSEFENNEVRFDFAALLRDNQNYIETTKIAGDAVNDWRYLATAYFLPQQKSEETKINATMEIKDANTNKATTQIVATDITAQRNYRTNIYGNLLTSNGTFNVVVDPDFEDNDHNVQSGVYDVTTSSLSALLTTNKDMEGDFVYNVSGLSETSDVTVEIPAGTKASSLTLNFTDTKDGAKMTIKDATSGAYAGTVVIKNPADKTVSELTVGLPAAHVYLAQGKYTKVTASTSSSTLVIGGGATVVELTVDKGNVEIESDGEVDTITKGEDNDDIVFVYIEEGAEIPEIDEDVEGIIISEEEESTGVYTINLEENLNLDQRLTLNKNTIINGNGKSLNYTGTDRAIQIEGGIVVINDLIVNMPGNTPEGTRGINLYNGDTNEAIDVTLNNVTVNGYKAYAVNIGGGKDNKLTINNSTLTGYAAINVHKDSENHTIVVDGSTLNGKNHNNNYHFGTVVVDGTNAHSLTITESEITTENLEGITSNYYPVIVSVNCTYDVCEGIDVAVRNVFEETKGLYHIGLASAIEEVDNAKIKLLADIELENIITIPSSKTVTLDLNGKTITGTDNTSKNFSIFDNRGNFTIKNTATSEGKLTLTATINSGWSRYSAVVANNPGGNLIIEKGVIIEHLGGTDMAYGIDNLTNGKGTTAVTTINGATIKSPYRAIRQFLNGVEATNELYVNSGIIEGANKSIWMQDPSANANTGKLVVDENAQLKGDVYLTVTAGSTEWPVDVTIAKAALVGESEILTSNVPEGYELVEVGGIYSILKTTNAGTADELVAALEKGENVKLTANIKIDPANMSNAYGTTGINVKNGQTIDGGGYTLDIKGAGGTWDSGINTTGGLIKDLTVTGSFRGIFINHNSTYSEKVVLKNVIIDGTTYTISCDQGMNQDFEAYNSTFNGWTSYAATIGTAKFAGCKFGEGSGYAYCRPYAPTEFIGCEFEAGFEMDPRAAVTFENCTIGGVALTAENLATLVISNIANATVK